MYSPSTGVTCSLPAISYCTQCSYKSFSSLLCSSRMCLLIQKGFSFLTEGIFISKPGTQEIHEIFKIFQVWSPGQHVSTPGDHCRELGITVIRKVCLALFQELWKSYLPTFILSLLAVLVLQSIWSCLLRSVTSHPCKSSTLPGSVATILLSLQRSLQAVQKKEILQGRISSFLLFNLKQLFHCSERPGLLQKTGFGSYCSKDFITTPLF